VTRPGIIEINNSAVVEHWSSNPENWGQIPVLVDSHCEYKVFASLIATKQNHATL